MAERKKLPGLLYDKSTGWWFSNLKDPSKRCGRTKYMWAKDQHKAQGLYFKQIERVVADHAVKNRFDRLCRKAGVKRKYGVGFYILHHTHATLIGENSNDFREVQAALGQLTIQQQETYRHDRKIKAFNAQQRLRCEMKISSIPKILHDKLSGYSV